MPTTEPRTAKGRWVLEEWENEAGSDPTMRAAVLAIEAEAEKPLRAALTALVTIIDTNALFMPLGQPHRDFTVALEQARGVLARGEIGVEPPPEDPE